tara:strand:+ start:31 stop:573 length:543 start_codon:yes stop_codon:yes gene_type:complete
MMMMMPLTFTTSFAPTPMPNVKSFNYQGDIAPTGYFDPLGLNSGAKVSESRIKYWREAELQHGRLAMLGAVVLSTLELKNPDMLSINYLSNLDTMMQSPFWGLVALYECSRLVTGYENPFTKYGNSFTLKTDYQPGNLLKLNPDNISTDRYNRELSNGRLAMLACAHIIGSEVATQHGLF